MDSGDGQVSWQATSVCLCTYNGGRYLKDLLDSLAAPTLLPAELLVGDDGSSDDTLEIVRDFAADASFPVKVLSNQRAWVPPATSKCCSQRRRAMCYFPVTRMISGRQRRSRCSRRRSTSLPALALPSATRR
jgi:GT2 family glycosyltransferase